MKEIRLDRQHTHAGITYPAGTTVQLPDDIADWLIETQNAVRVMEVDAIIAQQKKINSALGIDDEQVTDAR